MQITKIKVRQYFYKSQLIENNCVLFLQIDSKYWIKFTIDDGFAEIKKIKNIELEETSGDEEFNYPLQDYIISKNWGSIISINEYKYKRIDGESAGFIFVLENHILSYVQFKDRLDFIEGIKKELMKDYIIIPLENLEEKLA